MEEIVITSGKMNHHIDPVLHVWGWEIPVYLFLGGLVAGIVVLSALMVILGKTKEMSTAALRIPVLAPIFLSLGMFALLLDLENKIRVYQMYLTFQPTAPMSWGAWILILFYPFNLLFILTQVRTGFPEFYQKYITSKIPKVDEVINWICKFSSQITWINLFIGTFIGIYTGILLGAFAARPFWNSAILGPLFLVSGLSAASALILLLSKQEEEINLFQKVVFGLILTEVLFIALLIIELSTGPRITQQAVGLILGGELTAFFWIFDFCIGIVLPAILIFARIRGKSIPAFLAPIFVLLGGLLLRFSMVEAGQLSTWIPY
ncbi:polysulfide reductase NrfD [candidate division KSB1 bacterium]|nr:polysulfide reductase NrfD [candidate division KSB1 bacterium]